ncbi:chemoreceptor glutamine deamidase CheD [Lacimicrobium sp. SS2-24]|uniref:chemoreceptor glutamine deamidase CheD n=1 Tax=Lacimicrobium sp. SS2-24 TaxID=2005569 RepID=UPI000B4B6BA8|nr:chemoreceptor glutamine deamidase CheD [Lacimicrobium sp. SS2-24]
MTECAEPQLYANRYFDSHFKHNAVKILPGEFYATFDDTMIVTVLGSCVSVCLHDPSNGIRGMNHYLLPSDQGPKPSILSESARYGGYAMEILINQMLKLGAKRHNLVAKVFGGGNVMRGFMLSNVGERNVDFTFDYLKRENIPVIASDVLSDYPRKVYFLPGEGTVHIKKIRSLHNSTILDRESEYRLRLKYKSLDKNVDLF